MSDNLAPTGLRAAVLEQALGRRPPGRPVDAATPCTPIEAFRAAAEQLHGVLRSLGPADWEARAHHEIGTVRALVTHLLGVERLVLDWVTSPDGAPAVPTEHVAAARRAAADVDGIDADKLVERWFTAVQRVGDACAAAHPQTPILAHDLPTDVEGLLVLRAFELWAHLQDVCRATGRAEPPVDDARLAFMSSRLMSAMPIALLLRGVVVAAPSVRFVLTGPAGGCYDLVAGHDLATPPALTIVADAVDVCRVAARRLPAADLDASIDGDVDAAAAVLESLDAFARD